VLGCTHYPMLKGLIQRAVGGAVRVIDSAEQCAEDVAKRLRTAGLLRGLEPVKSKKASHASHTPFVAPGPHATPPRLQCFVTDDSPRFGALAARFLGVEIDPPIWVSPEELYRMDGAATVVEDPTEPIRRAV